MNRYFVCHRIASAVKEVEFVSCDTDKYLVVTKFSKTLSVSKQTAQKFGIQKLNLKKPSEVEFREQHHNKIPNRLAALENFNDSEDINTTWENTKRE